MEKTFRIIGIVCACVFVGWLAWYLFSEPDVHNQRERADDVGAALGNTGAAQRDVERDLERIGRGIDGSIKRIDEIAGGIDEAESRIDAVQERRGECAEILADSERRIEESQRILQSVRSRAR